MTKIEATYSPASAPVEPTVYPCLKRHALTGRVVLFTGPAQGVVLVSGIGGEGPGFRAASWPEHVYETVTGSVTLTQGKA